MTSNPQHPEIDVLADLAADVLPVEEARTVETHVISCPACADLLADAERVRSVLRIDDVGPMPDDVWARIEAALGQESQVRTTGQVPIDAAVHPLDALAGDGPAFDTRPFGRHPADHQPAPSSLPDGVLPLRRRDRRGAELDPSTVHETAAGAPAAVSDATLTGVPEVDEGTGLTRVIRPLHDLTPASAAERAAEGTAETGTLPALRGSRALGLRRPGRRHETSRRDVRDSAREEAGVTATLRRARATAGRRTAGRRGPLLAAAAGVVLAAGLGGVLFNTLNGTGNDTTAAGAAAASGAELRAIAPVLATDQNYTEARLAAQAKALVSAATTSDALTSGGAAATAASDSGGGGSASAPAASAPTAKLSRAAAGESALITPAVLAECLKALNASDQIPLAVDIARYENREAAIIVLRGEDGGLEIWAVSRDCGSGDDGSLAFLAVPPA